ncbi:hypothetical protein MIB92_04255 [Aestuariirhabdus sp. Z084]|uniref:hypothetical protein n=1 Tax=Aestuariirhabdus haliotis TaxID=2918751 RepID=UPI00201B44A6|nr:hypothetical protein [Aestuariirhabdus haliotis]MCL6414852.1 hypothetical protein [Aestuariirhabdus haliotis]MCL6418784.1 hypothetical protein [Aestuariirhabdus haliotis]
MALILITVALTVGVILLCYLSLYLSSRARRKLSRQQVLGLIKAKVNGRVDTLLWVTYLSVPVDYDPWIEEARVACREVQNQADLAAQSPDEESLSDDAKVRLMQIHDELAKRAELIC